MRSPCCRRRDMMPAPLLFATIARGNTSCAGSFAPRPGTAHKSGRDRRARTPRAESAAVPQRRTLHSRCNHEKAQEWKRKLGLADLAAETRPRPVQQSNRGVLIREFYVRCLTAGPTGKLTVYQTNIGIRTSGGLSLPCALLCSLTSSTT